MYVFRAELGCYNGSSPNIEVVPCLPWEKITYPINVKYLQSVRKQIRGLEDTGVIMRSTGDYTNPLVVVPKGNGDLRICIDPQNFNKVVRKQYRNVVDFTKLPVFKD